MCRLCQREATLCESHVVPEFFYAPIYDEKHRLFPIVGGKPQAGPPLQKGLRERLLCSDCESRLAQHEKHVREVLFGGTEIGGQNVGGSIELTDLDYTSVRLCFLSVLWRMSVARHRSWREVQLGPHEDRFRLMLLRGDPGRSTQYGFLCVVPLIEGSFSPDLILGPDRSKAYGQLCYRLILGGLVFAFFVSCKPFPEHLRQWLITPSGTWRIPVADAARIDLLLVEAKRIAAHRGPRA
jgi:hypothetical protein